jgi:hypothetical protein
MTFQQQITEMPLHDAISLLIERLRKGELPLLGTNTKIVKNTKDGWLTAGLSLAPHRSAGDGINTCPQASPGCVASCLQFAGRNNFSYLQRLRAAKTRFLYNYNDTFYDRLNSEVFKHIKKAKRKGLQPAIRPNVLSDIPGMAVHIANLCAAVGAPIKVYDYTKRISWVSKWAPHHASVHWVLSRSERNHNRVFDMPYNVAVVFDTKVLPETYMGRRVVDGDESDARFLEDYDEPVVIGLKLKGTTKAKNHARKTGFAVQM